MLTPWLVFFSFKRWCSGQTQMDRTGNPGFSRKLRGGFRRLFFWRLKNRPKNQRLFTLQKKEGFEEKSLGCPSFHQFCVDSARNFLKTLCLLQLLEFLQVKLKMFCMVFLRLSHRQCCFIQPYCDNAVHTNIQWKKQILSPSQWDQNMWQRISMFGWFRENAALKNDSFLTRYTFQKTKIRLLFWNLKKPKKPSISESCSCSCEFCLPRTNAIRWTINGWETPLRYTVIKPIWQHQIQTSVFKGPLEGHVPYDNDKTHMKRSNKIGVLQLPDVNGIPVRPMTMWQIPNSRLHNDIPFCVKSLRSKKSKPPPSTQSSRVKMKSIPANWNEAKLVAVSYGNHMALRVTTP